MQVNPIDFENSESNLGLAVHRDTSNPKGTSTFPEVASKHPKQGKLASAGEPN